MTTQKLNDAPILGQLDGHWQKIAMALLHKLSPGVPVRLGVEEFKKLNDDFAPGVPVILANGTKEAIELSLVTEERAFVISQYSKTMGGTA